MTPRERAEKILNAHQCGHQSKHNILDAMLAFAAEVRAEERKRCAKAAKSALDNCTHPDCVAERKVKNYSSCAGGRLARKVVKAIERGRNENHS